MRTARVREVMTRQVVAVVPDYVARTGTTWTDGTDERATPVPVASARARRS
jgi:hypothetical protein